LAFSSRGETYVYVEANIPTQQSAAGQNPRLSCPDGKQERPPGVEAAPCQGKKTTHTCSLLTSNDVMRRNLRDQEEFQNVYRNGTRYDAASISVFVIENQSSHHRLGVTASKKALGKAVQRNRAKRLLREAFRSNEECLKDLNASYDWVLNAKAKILSDKVRVPTLELQQIVEKVRKSETLAAAK
jgi:ribonuclease P protein component